MKSFEERKVPLDYFQRPAELVDIQSGIHVINDS